LFRKSKEIDRWENLGEDGRIIAEWMVKKLEGRKVDSSGVRT